MKHVAKVTRVEQETPHISTIFFTVDDGAYPFTAGQYISVYFDQTGVKTGKAYSLSSAPFDEELSITVKEVGEFSQLLCALQPGDDLHVSSPYGFFNVHDELPIIAIAAGVGIAPIWSIIRDELAARPSRSVSLYLSAPTKQELVFHNKVEELFSRYARTAASYFVTREPVESTPAMQGRRFAVKTDISIDALAVSRFYICGSQDFVRAMWIQLMEAGVDEPRIATETFFESTP